MTRASVTCLEDCDVVRPEQGVAGGWNSGACSGILMIIHGDIGRIINKKAIPLYQNGILCLHSTY